MGLTPHPHLEWRGPRKSIAIPLLTLRAFVAYKKSENLPTYFGNRTLHVSDSSSVHHQELFTVHTAMVYVIQVC